tara:strand:- start:29 stop:199 length:171 start_codon:yes stop_codon:yes gene_type:complete
MTQEQEDMIRLLKQPHRINNPAALFRLCEKAAVELETLLNRPKGGRPKSIELKAHQ